MAVTTEGCVHLYLAHTDAACHATVVTEVDYSIYRYETTQVLAIDGATAYIAHIRDNSYQLKRYEVPPIAC